MTIPATWVGPAGTTYLGDILIPGESVVEVGEDEAITSENWQPVNAPALTPGNDTTGKRTPASAQGDDNSAGAEKE